VLLNLSRKENTKNLWDMLGNLYQLKSLLNKLFLQKKLDHLRMDVGDFMIENLNSFIILVS
jgi:hypothetical protein